MNYSLSTGKARELLDNKLLHYFGVKPTQASYEQYYKAIALTVRDMMSSGLSEFNAGAVKAGSKQIYYLSMEFLMGRSLKNNLYNLGLTDTFRAVLNAYDVKLEKIFEQEPDAGLGNGGLGRLAACYLDALASQGYRAMGYSIRYEYGIFRQKLVDGWQTELPDFWLPGGEVWLAQHEDAFCDVKFEGEVEETWDGSYHHVEIKNAKVIKAIPYDMTVPGKGGQGVAVLRLWSAKAPGLDMDLFNQGDYMRAVEQDAMAGVISKVLYPADNHEEGKSLRIRQQYFLVSATVQDIIRRHLAEYGTVENLSQKAAIHINDTHPTLAIPELMRILLDDCGYGWDDAWRLVTETTAYTNHTVMREALECWPERLLQRLLPRIYQITKEIDNRFRAFVWQATLNADTVESTAIISNGAVRMANLCVAACHSVNGVSALHSEIIRDELFNDFYRVMPKKFKNVTNGIAYRRWLCQANPGLADFITDCIGAKFVSDARELEKLLKFTDDHSALEALDEIKRENKQNLANRILKTSNIKINPDSIFDVQVKRLHEYKRQHLNALHILALYRELKANPGMAFVPRTYIFAAKAAPGYFMAKKIISLICSLANVINNDPDIKDLIKIVYLEDYNVTMAETLMPAADISEQISLAGTEASGTGNMKLMLNGAITLGTLDGANVEIREAVGDENIFLFGMTEPEVLEMRRSGYKPFDYYLNNHIIHDAVDFINTGVDGKQFKEIGSSLMRSDPYMALADFEDYARAQLRAAELWKDRERWNRMSLINIAGAGRFSADRAVNEYARDIWNAEPVFK